MVERDDDGREEEAPDRLVVAVAGRRQRHARLERAGRVVGEAADDAAAERRQAGEIGVGVARERAAQRPEAARRVELDRLAAGRHERVAPDLLAALDRLEQEAGTPVPHAQERGHRREQVGRQLAHGRARAPARGGRRDGRGDGVIGHGSKTTNLQERLGGASGAATSRD